MLTQQLSLEKDRKYTMRGVLITVLLPIVILVLNIVGTGFLVLKVLDVTDNAKFEFGFLALLAFVVVSIFFCLIRISPLQLKTRITINIAVSILITVPMIINAVTDTGMYVISKLPLKNEYECRIYTKSFWETSRPLYYEFRRGNDVKVSMTYYDSVDDIKKYKFQAIYGDNDTVVGIIQMSKDLQQLIAMYDSKINKSWPRSEAIGELGNAFRKLKEGNPNMPHPSYFSAD